MAHPLVFFVADASFLSTGARVVDVGSLSSQRNASGTVGSEQMYYNTNPLSLSDRGTN